MEFYYVYNKASLIICFYVNNCRAHCDTELMRKSLGFILGGVLLLVRLCAARLPDCVAERSVNNISLSEDTRNSLNNNTYLCSLAQLSEFYDPANIVCGQSGDPASPYVSAFECPAGLSIQCVLFSGWGSVAGSCTACDDTCSTAGLAGAESCCGKACTTETSECEAFSWVDSSSDTCGNSGSEGYCSCCPDCASCEAPKEDDDGGRPGGDDGGSDDGGSGDDAGCGECRSMCNDSGGCYAVDGGADCNDGGGPTSNLCSLTCEPCESNVGSAIDESFCDCRNGLSVSDDYAPCWNSCMDCFGDSTNGPGDVTLYPSEALIGDNCLGKDACYIGTLTNDDGSGNWAECESDDVATCEKIGDSLTLMDEAKFKALMLCG